MSQIWTICINCHLKLFTAAVLAFLTNYILSSCAFFLPFRQGESPTTSSYTHPHTHDTNMHVMHMYVQHHQTTKSSNGRLACVDLCLILYFPHENFSKHSSSIVFLLNLYFSNHLVDYSGSNPRNDD